MRKENGVLTIEATIVVAFCLFTIMILLDFGFVTYHKIIVTQTASEVAADAANIYANQAADPFVGYVGMSDFYSHNLYRHFALGESKMDRKFKEKAYWYACYRIKKNELLKSESSFEDVKTELTNEGDLGRLQLKVTIKRKYEVLSAGIFRLFGMDTTYTCEGVGYAECIDTIDYINMQNMKKELIEKYLKVIDEQLSKIVNTITDFKSVFGVD